MARTISWLAVAVLLAAVCLGFSSSSEPPAPVPSDVSIQAPDPALPAEVKALVGKWTGEWNSRWDSVLYVEKVDKDSAQVVLAFGGYTTSHGTCHCAPNWVRVQSAKVKYSDGKAKLEFFTPKFRPRWLKESHTVTGAYEETYGGSGGSSGRYSYFFVLNGHEPDLMKGDFFSARNSQLHIKLRKVE